MFSLLALLPWLDLKQITVLSFSSLDACLRMFRLNRIPLFCCHLDYFFSRKCFQVHTIYFDFQKDYTVWKLVFEREIRILTSTRLLYLFVCLFVYQSNLYGHPPHEKLLWATYNKSIKQSSYKNIQEKNKMEIKD